MQLVFTLSQHSRDKPLTTSFVEYFECGNLYKRKENFEYRVVKFSDLENKIIPFFKEYPILGAKSKDFEDFCKITAIIEKKGHLTSEGLEQIRRIKGGMNTGRKFS